MLVLMMVPIIGWVIVAMDDYMNADDTRLWNRRLVLLGVISSILALVIPSKDTMWTMVGAYYTQKALQSEDANEIGQLVLERLKSELKIDTK